jgi:hypothetical protein
MRSLRQPRIGIVSAQTFTMLQIFVNDLPCPVEAAPQTWGDLLANLDDRAAGEGLLLTSARFDGVDEPSFREPEVTARRLSDVGRVDVETATPGAFLRRCLLESIEPLSRAADLAVTLGEQYRGRELASCHDGLTLLAGELRGLTALVGMLEGPLQLDLSAFMPQGTTSAQQMEELGAALDAIVMAQESEDWLTVADVLEYDLEPAIRRWVELLTLVAERL